MRKHAPLRWRTLQARRIWFVGLFFAAAALPLQAQDWRDIARTRQLVEEEDLAVHVRYGAGKIQIRPSNNGQLFHLRLHYDAEKFRPVADYERGTLTAGIQGLRERDNIEIRGRTEGNLELELSPEVALDLTLEMGAVRSEIELGGLRIEAIDLRTGASETRLHVSSPNPIDAESVSIQVGAADFIMDGLGNLNAENIEIHAGIGDVRVDLSGEWRNDADLKVEMGLGSLEFRLPEGVGVEIEQDSFLTTLDAEGMERRGGRYLTPGFERASRKVRIEIDAAFGKIRVLPPR